MDKVLSVFSAVSWPVAAGVTGVLLLLFILVAIAFRTVVDPNKVHIVQSWSSTTSYGKGQAGGNVYYKWPSWVPLFGVSSMVLQVNNFDLNLHAYKAYDKERVPFELDITSFFRIEDTNLAAQRVSSFDELKAQLMAIVQGAVRKILASHDINGIMVDRATFGQQFTSEVEAELKNWGVVPVKNMELMDIRDADGSKVIANIMAMKASHIEMESRTAVAANMQRAETAEIDARQAVHIREQDAAQAVGERTAEKEKMVGIADQKSRQEVKAQEAITRQKEMDVLKVGQVRQAEITREAAVVAAEQSRQTTILEAEGQLEATKRRAEGARVEGEAKGAAEQAILMAPVNAQIELAEKIATLAGYQGYLVAIEAIKAQMAVGVEQAKALADADVKVIANAGNAVAGATSAMQLFTPQGGLSVGGMIEALGATPDGRKLLDAVTTRLAASGASPAPPATPPAA